MRSEQIEQVLHDEIPLTQQIGIRVEEACSEKIVLRAPLEPNINHKRTAFGGSLYSVAVLTGWSFLFNRLMDNDLHGHIVIASSEMKYDQPVDGDIIAVCNAPGDNEWRRFLKMFQKKGRGKIRLEVSVTHNGHLACIFIGNYVVHR